MFPNFKVSKLAYTVYEYVLYNIPMILYAKYNYNKQLICTIIYNKDLQNSIHYNDNKQTYNYIYNNIITC